MPRRASLSQAAAEYHEQLAPAIDRVWRDEIADIAPRPARLGAPAAVCASEWTPEYFEFSFGLQRRGSRSERACPIRCSSTAASAARLGRSRRDARRDDGSCASPTTRRARTGRRGRRSSAAARCCSRCSTASPSSRRSDRPVTSGRLFYCTAAGGFTDHEIPINDANRRAGLEALEIVDRAIELGFLPAAPASARARGATSGPSAARTKSSACAKVSARSSATSTRCGRCHSPDSRRLARSGRVQRRDATTDHAHAIDRQRPRRHARRRGRRRHGQDHRAREADRARPRRRAAPGSSRSSRSRSPRRRPAS